MTFTLEFALSWVVCVLTSIFYLVLLQLMRLIFSIVNSFTLKRNLSSLILVTCWWSVGLNLLRIVFSIVCGWTLEFCVSWNIFMLTILHRLSWNFFVLVARVVFGFTIKITWFRFILIFISIVSTSFFNLVGMVELIVRSFKCFWIIVSLLVLMSAFFLVWRLDLIWSIIMVICCLSFKFWCRWSRTMMPSTCTNLTNTLCVVLTRIT